MNEFEWNWNIMNVKASKAKDAKMYVYCTYSVLVPNHQRFWAHSGLLSGHFTVDRLIKMSCALIRHWSKAN